MQMLAAGGMPLLTDGVREADTDNPQGYHELEAVKGLARDAGFLERADGRAVKVVAPLLRYLPEEAGRRYRVVFSQRALDEVMASQSLMLQRLGSVEVGRDDAKLEGAFAGQLEGVHDLLLRRTDMDALFLRYAEVVADPVAAARGIAVFLGTGLDPGAMAAVVDASLYRQRRRR